MNTILKVAIATIVFMVANIIAGILTSEHEFDLEVLKQSIIKYIGILVVAGLLYAGSYLGSDFISQILGKDLGIPNIISLGLATVALNYAIQAITKFTKLVGIKVTGEDDSQNAGVVSKEENDKNE